MHSPHGCQQLPFFKVGKPCGGKVRDRQVLCQGLGGLGTGRGVCATGSLEPRGQGGQAQGDGVSLSQLQKVAAHGGHGWMV